MAVAPGRQGRIQIYHFEPVRLAILVPGNDKRAVNGIVDGFCRCTSNLT